MRMQDLNFAGVAQGIDYTNVSFSFHNYRVVLTFDKKNDITFRVAVWDPKSVLVKEWSAKTERGIKEPLEDYFTDLEYKGVFDKIRGWNHVYNA